MPITELITGFDTLIQGVVYGAIYIIVFRFATYNKLDYSNSAFLIKSIAVNFLFVQLFNRYIVFPSADTDEAVIIFRIVFCVIIAFVMSVIYKSSVIRSILFNLGIRRTLGSDYLENIMPTNVGTILLLKHESCENVEGAVYLAGAIDQIDDSGTKVEDTYITIENYCYISASNQALREETKKKLLIRIGDYKDIQFVNMDNNPKGEILRRIRSIAIFCIALVLLCMIG